MRCTYTAAVAVEHVGAPPCRHQPAWTATQNIREKGSVAYDVEDILRTQTYVSGDTKFRGTSMSAMVSSTGQADVSLNFYW